MKHCKVCEQDKPIEEFYKSGGLTCKSCRSKIDKEAWAARRGAWKSRYSSPEGRTTNLLNNGRQRAKQKFLDFDLDFAWLLEKIKKGICEVTGIPFDLQETTGSGKNRAFTPSLDRINPNKGYTKDNVQVVCWIYNAAKGVNSHADVLKMASSLVPKYVH